MLDDDGRQYACNLNYKSVTCDQIPELFLDKLVAKKHFSKFGKINRFILRPKRLSCTVEYETEDAAERAFMQAYDFNGHKFIVNYSEHEVGHVQNTEEWVDPDVQAELDAMNPGHRMAAPPSSMILHMRPTAAPPALSAAKFAAGRVGKSVTQFPTPKVPPATKAIDAFPKVDANLRSELETLLRRAAHTDEDKYRVLDARDKLIRLTTVRQTDIKKAVSTKGTCPDMCPEKERLMREFQRQVSSFEMNGESDDNSNSTISHRRAIKEYSRSSADQEVPLTHELRTENVLQMTMLYLMHCIMDLCDDPLISIADWFHFVWDRTRSIRKDITQQELCSLGAVQLVEQCARFHIHCAARLVAEEPSVFDKKINAENLTKCLQTLKYIYQDLRIKNVHCPCEAEFRSYIVLLNLGDANFLWELKQLPTHIQQSGEINRAIAFYNALQNNNYVRFFDMIRSAETSYLSACILLGYFNKLRLRATEVIIKSHNWRKNAVFLPLKYLTKVLGFEDVQTTAEFLAWHGLQCDEERVMLERIKKPDLEYSMDRAMMLVESKRKISVGECVCGQPLDSVDIFERHQPHNSFDVNGVLKPEAWTADDQLRGEAAVKKAVERKAQQVQNVYQQHQQQPKTLAPTTVKTDMNLFKVPQASPPLSPKQQQQQQQQKMQQQQHPIPNTTAFGVAGSQFGVAKTPSPQTTSNFKFGSGLSLGSNSNSRSGTFSSNTSNTSTSGQSLFKMPMDITTKSSPTSASSSVAFFNSIFTPNPEKPVPTAGSIFGGTSSLNTSAATGNIFGAVAKETANIFQKNSKEPVPLRNDNVFQHFQTDPPEFDNHVATAKATEMPNRQQQLQEEQQKRAAAEQRMRELEEEQRRKQEQLQAERQKLKELEEKRKVDAARKRNLEQLQFKTARITEKELRELLTEQITQIAHAELTHYQSIDRRCYELSQEMLAEGILAQVQEIVQEEYADMCHEQTILQHYFQRWLQHTRKRMQQRKLMDSTPIWVTTDTRAEQVAKLLHPSQHENLQMIKRYRHGQPCDFKLLLWQSPLVGPPPQIDLFEMYRQHARQLPAASATGCLPTRKYFKLILTLPGEREELPGLESLCNKWLRKYVRKPKGDTDAYICGLQHELALCVRKLSGVLSQNECGQRARQECDNADAVVCFMSSCNLTSTRKRLHHLLKLSSIHKSVPVAFVVYDARGHDERMLSDYLQLDDLLEQQKVFSYRFCGCLEDKRHFRFDSNFKRALRFVLRESGACNAEAESLEMQNLHSWLEANLGQEIWLRWHESTLENPPFAKICSMPQHVIGLYNEAVDHLLQLVTMDWQEAPDFPAELRQFVPPLESDIPCGLAHFPADWKNPNRQQKIVKFLLKLKLPAIKAPLLAANVEDWELWLLNYASVFITQDEMAATQASYEAINAFIAQLNQPDLAEYELAERFGLISFLPVTKALAFAHANNVLKQIAPTASILPKEVVYRRQALLDYHLIPWWLNYKPIKLVTVDYSLENNVANSNVTNEETDSNEELEVIVKQAEEISRRAEEQLLALKRPALRSNTNELKRELDENLYQFELAKRFGCFDVPLFTLSSQNEDDIDVSLTGAVGGVTHENAFSPHDKKRKCLDSTTTKSDMEAVMARAFDLIHKVESKQDRQERVQQASKLEFAKNTIKEV